MDKFYWNNTRPVLDQHDEIYRRILQGEKLQLVGYPKTNNALYMSIRRRHNFCVRISSIPNTKDVIVH